MPPHAFSITQSADFALRFGVNVAQLRDDAGHPLHEVEGRAAHGASEYRRCPYSDERNGFQINVRALREAGGAWTRVIATAGGLREWLHDSYQPPDSAHTQWLEFALPVFLPLVCLTRASKDTLMPQHLSIALKSYLDMPTAAQSILLARALEHDRIDSRPFEPEEFLRAVHHRGLLLNGPYACAGPETMLSDAISMTTSRGLTSVEGVLDPYPMTDWAVPLLLWPIIQLLGWLYMSCASLTARHLCGGRLLSSDQAFARRLSEVASASRTASAELELTSALIEGFIRDQATLAAFDSDGLHSPRASRELALSAISREVSVAQTMSMLRVATHALADDIRTIWGVAHPEGTWIQPMSADELRARQDLPCATLTGLLQEVERCQ